MIKSKITRGVVVAISVLSLGGCAGMDENQQRMVSGGAIGVAAGAVTTVVTGGCIACGMAIGGAVGTAGGYLVGQIDGATRSGPSPSVSQGGTNYSSNTYSGSGASPPDSVPQGYPPGGYGSH